MSFQTQSIIDPILEFLKTCPFAKEYYIDFENVDVQKFSNNAPTGSAIDYIGQTLPNDTKDLIGGREITRQANFQIFLKRQSNDNAYRKEIAEFLFDFERWVDYCQYKGLTPKIGDLSETEVMWADNGMYLDEWEESQKTSLYVIQLHIIYQKDYELEE